MPFFDEYICAKEDSRLKDVSTRIMKLAIYCDYSTRFKNKDGKYPCEDSEQIFSMIEKITKKYTRRKHKGNDESFEDMVDFEREVTAEIESEIMDLEQTRTELSSPFKKYNGVFIPDGSQIIYETPNENFNSEQLDLYRTNSIYLEETQNLKLTIKNNDNSQKLLSDSYDNPNIFSSLRPLSKENSQNLRNSVEKGNKFSNSNNLIENTCNLPITIPKNKNQPKESSLPSINTTQSKTSIFWSKLSQS